MDVRETADLYPGGKKAYVAGMFDDIALKYDFLNHSLSFGIDIRWRKKLAASLDANRHIQILDIATGTADLAITIAGKLPDSNITGVDIAENMLRIGTKKIEKKGLAGRIRLKSGDAENLEFNDHSFDAATVAFGVRNFENLSKGLSEMHRVLKSGGIIAILEFSMPGSKIFLMLYKFYFRVILPFIGRLISKHFFAYSYLPDSVSGFPDPASFQVQLQQIGFKDVKCKKLTFGICTLYTGIR
jgi:demethylmenaquinone methyltransferase/2-methoxy-6-polyprenyl-1,4-benzoquinol methylase